MQVSWSVLIIEDSDSDREILLRLLNQEAECKCLFAERLSNGIGQLATNAIDVILLDLNLPDCHELDGLLQIRSHAPQIPVVVLTGMEDSKNAFLALQQGAQDYLVKGKIDGPLLIRSMGYAIERQRLLQELADTREREQRERELRMLEKSGTTSATTTTAKMFGQESINKREPNTFAKLVQRYEELIDLALEQRVLKVEHDLSGQLRSLAERLCYLRAVPRDIVELHGTAIKRRTAAAPTQKIQVYREEGQYLLLELMGNLCSFYRKYSTGIMTSDPKQTGFENFNNTTESEAVQ